MGDLCTLAVIGDGAVGKSSIIDAFRSDGFAKVYKQTIGIDFYEKTIALRGDKYVSLKVWDIGGQSISSKNLQKYLGSTNVILLVYDVTNPESFANLDDWLTMARKYSKTQYIYIVGNKVDLIANRQITERQHNAFKENNGLYGGLFVSAKTGENVVKIFYQVAGESVNCKLMSHELDVHNKVIKAHVVRDNKDEGRTAFADQVEAEDMDAERRKNNEASNGCNCVIS